VSRLGIIDVLELAVTLVFAIPIGLFGIEKLLQGELIAGGFGIGVAILMIVIERYVWTPDDVPGDAAQSVVGRIVRRSDDSEREEPDEQ